MVVIVKNGAKNEQLWDIGIKNKGFRIINCCLLIVSGRTY